jgi:putative addiction module killer protein
LDNSEAAAAGLWAPDQVVDKWLATRIHMDTAVGARMNTIIRSSEFDGWLSALADHKAKARVLARITAAKLGNFGDSEPVGEGVSEMRIHVGAGYRVYFTRTDLTVYFLLTGGDKSSQKRDITRAKTMAQALNEAKP